MIAISSARAKTGARKFRNFALNTNKNGRNTGIINGNNKLKFVKENIAQTIYVCRKAER
jgi:hypothetical protein